MARHSGFFDTNARSYFTSGGFKTKNAMFRAVADGDVKNLDAVLDAYFELLVPLFENGGIEFARESIMFVFAQVSAVATTNGLDDWIAHDMKTDYYYDIEVINNMEDMLSLCRRFIENFTCAVQRSKRENFYSPLTKQICEYIHWNIGGKLSISTIADEFHFSEGYISHKFKKETGMTVAAYITKTKIAEAKEMLRTELSLVEISEALGFCSQSHFSKVFRAETDMSPAEWRRHLATA